MCSLMKPKLLHPRKNRRSVPKLARMMCSRSRRHRCLRLRRTNPKIRLNLILPKRNSQSRKNTSPVSCRSAKTLLPCPLPRRETMPLRLIPEAWLRQLPSQAASAGRRPLKPWMGRVFSIGLTRQPQKGRSWTNQPQPSESSVSKRTQNRLMSGWTRRGKAFPPRRFSRRSASLTKKPVKARPVFILRMRSSPRNSRVSSNSRRKKR